MQRKIHNQTLFVAALSVYFGLLIVGAPPQVLVQHAEAQNKRQAASEFNRRALKDFASKLRQQIVSGQINLANSCSISAEATIESNARLSNFKVINQVGDAVLCDAAIDFISAINDSGAFAQLKSIFESPTTKVTYAFEANNGDFKVVNAFSLKSADQTQKTAQLLNFALFASQQSQQNQTAKEQELLRATKIVAQEKELVILIQLPRAVLDSFLKADEKAN